MRKYEVGHQYDKNGFHYEVLVREGDVVIASQDGGRWYEVFELVQKKDREVMGVHLMASEGVPSTANWGDNAFTVYTYPQALDKLKTIHLNINRRNEQNTINH